MPATHTPINVRRVWRYIAVSNPIGIALIYRYFQNETFIIVTPEPWSVPELKMVAQMKHHATLKGHKIAIKMLAVRGAAVGRVEEARLLGKTISETDAIHMAAEAIDLPSPMMINTDDNFVAHCEWSYYLVLTCRLPLDRRDIPWVVACLEALGMALGCSAPSVQVHRILKHLALV